MRGRRAYRKALKQPVKACVYTPYSFTNAGDQDHGPSGLPQQRQDWLYHP